MNGHGGPVPDLGAVGQVAIVAFSLYPANAVDVLDGGLTDKDAAAHLRLLAIPQQVGHLAPLRVPQLHNLRDQIDGILSRN